MHQPAQTAFEQEPKPYAEPRRAVCGRLDSVVNRKPRFTEPCNHCGECCSAELCVIAETLYEAAPCPALTGEGKCELVEIERASGLDSMIEKALGIGCGCSMPDPKTTTAEIAAFDFFSATKMYG